MGGSIVTEDPLVMRLLMIVNYHWFITSKKIEKFDNSLHANDDMLFLMKILINSHLLPIKDILYM